MRQANAEIGVAFAGYFPAVSLNGLVGYSGNPFAAAFGPTNPVWSFGASLAQPLFNGGLTTAQVEAARQTYQADVATYRQTVLTAIQQVEDALAGIRILSREVKVQAENVRISRQATQITLNEYQAGTQAFTAVVTAEAQQLSAEEVSAHDPGAGPDRGGRPYRCARRRLDPNETARRRGADIGHSAALRKPHAIDRRAGRGRKSLIREGWAMIKAIRIGVAALAASAVLAGCVSVGAPEKEGQLAAAGFVRQPADTPLKMTKLQALPQNTIVVAQRKGHNVYIYADAAGCGCAYHRQRRRLSAISADPHRQQHRPNAGDHGDPEPGSGDGLGRRLGSIRPRLVLTGIDRSDPYSRGRAVGLGAAGEGCLTSPRLGPTIGPGACRSSC